MNPPNEFNKYNAEDDSFDVGEEDADNLFGEDGAPFWEEELKDALETQINPKNYNETGGQQ